MYAVGILLIYLAIKKDYEPALLLPMGFGAILVNLPLSGVINEEMEGIGVVNGIIEWLFNVGIDASEALPILLFIGIGAMIDFGPLLSMPSMFLFGAGAQFGIFFAICVAVLMGFDLKDAASIGIIGAADGPTSILVLSLIHISQSGTWTGSGSGSCSGQAGSGAEILHSGNCAKRGQNCGTVFLHRQLWKYFKASERAL